MSKKKHWFFLRGIIRESGHWDGFLERAREAMPDCEVFALDLPGNGPRFREQSPLTIKETAAAVRRSFLERKGDENFLFAISLGGMVGFQWMYDHPLDLNGMVLGNTSLKGLSPFYHRLVPVNYGKILKMVFAGQPYRERTILEMTSRSPEKFVRLEKEWCEIAAARPVSVSNSLRQLLAASRFYAPQGAPPGKVWLLSGARDQLVDPTCSATIARHWNLPLATHPEAGHDLTLDQPEWVLEKLREFSREGIHEKRDE